jgi:hypothetical protein
MLPNTSDINVLVERKLPGIHLRDKCLGTTLYKNRTGDLVLRFAFLATKRLGIDRSNARQNLGDLDDPHDQHKPRDPFVLCWFVMG